MDAADPFEIQADVHWTHVREREEEEHMAPAPGASASGGNCSGTEVPEPLRPPPPVAAEDASVRVTAIGSMGSES